MGLIGVVIIQFGILSRWHPGTSTAPERELLRRYFREGSTSCHHSCHAARSDDHLQKGVTN